MYLILCTLLYVKIKTHIIFFKHLAKTLSHIEHFAKYVYQILDTYILNFK